MHLVYFYDRPYEGRPIAAKLVKGTIEDALGASLPEHTSVSNNYYISIARENI